MPQWPSSIVDLVRGWQACPFSDFKQSERSLRLGAYPSIVCGRIFTVFLIWPSVLGKNSQNSHLSKLLSRNLTDRKEKVNVRHDEMETHLCTGNTYLASFRLQPIGGLWRSNLSREERSCYVAGTFVRPPDAKLLEDKDWRVAETIPHKQKKLPFLFLFSCT